MGTAQSEWHATTTGACVNTMLEELHGFTARCRACAWDVHLIPKQGELRVVAAAADGGFMLLARFPKEEFFPRGFECSGAAERAGLDVIVDYLRMVDLLETVEADDEVHLRLALPKEEGQALEVLLEIRADCGPTYASLPARPGLLANTFAPIATDEYPVSATIARFNAFLKRLALYSPLAEIMCKGGKVMASAREEGGPGVCLTELPTTATAAQLDVDPREYNLSALMALMTHTRDGAAPRPVRMYLGARKPLCMQVSHLCCYIAPQGDESHDAETPSAPDLPTLLKRRLS